MRALVCATAGVAAIALAGCRAEPSTASAAVFTPAHATFRDSVRDFFGSRPAAVQPIAFPHNTHVANKLGCTDYCHEAATKGPIAGLPSVKTCMICHDAIATDRPLIKRITTEYSDKHLDIPWQRVYGYAPQAHVRFNHAPHLRAKVECSTCHGNIAGQTVAQRNVNLTMGFCVNCHRANHASNDCLACHF
jgi:hypothetical protein